MSKARLVITAPFTDHQSPAEVAARYGVHPKSSYVRFEATMPNATRQSDFTHYRLGDGIVLVSLGCFPQRPKRDEAAGLVQ